MNVFVVLPIIMGLMFGLPATAGFVVGNGGDAIVCKKTQDNHLEGTYSLDYVVTLSDKNREDGLAPVDSWNHSSERLLKLLKDKVPTLAPYFEEFRTLVFNKDYSKTKVWESAPFGLVELDDQNITSLIPENCKKEGKTQVIQAVIREFQSFSGVGHGHMIYKYDPSVVGALDQKAPLQLSFLLVHEWLWDLSQNVERNRRINRFLHAQEIETMSSEAVIKSLQGMGLVIPEVQSDLFDDQLCQGTPLTAEQIMAHYPDPFVLANWGQLSIVSRQRDVSCPGNICHSDWRKTLFPSPLLEDYKYFLSPSWSGGPDGFPLKIVSPSYMNREGRQVNYGAGQLACRLTQDPKQNVECKILDPSFVYPLFYVSGSEVPLQAVPVVKGILTTECFRLKAIGNLRSEVIGPGRGDGGTLVMEIETVFYLRAKDGAFLKPR